MSGDLTASLEGSVFKLDGVELKVTYSPGQFPTIVLVHGGLGDRLTHHMPSSSHLIVPNLGHSVMVEAPNIVNQAWQLLHWGELVESWVDLVSNGWVSGR